jgi:hypothetical protein
MRRREVISHPSAARHRNLEALLKKIRVGYHSEWEALRRRAAAAADVEALVEAVEAWLQRYSLLDAAGLAVPAAVALLAEDLPNRPDLVKLAMVFALRGHIKAEAPAPAHFEFEFRYKHVFGDGAPWLRGFDPQQYRAAVIADAVAKFKAEFEPKLDAALEGYLQNCAAAGIALNDESMKLDQSLGLLARYLMRGATVEQIAEEFDLDISTVSRRLQEAARSCGLTLRRPGRRKKTAD